MAKTGRANRDDIEQYRAPAPTKREMVIAQRQAQVAEGDSVLSISNRNNIPEADLLAANPGVVTIRPGQVINIPRPPVVPGSTAVGNQSGYAMQGGGVSTTNQYGAGITKTPYASRGTAGYYAAYNQANTGTIPQIQSYEQTAIGNNSGYAMQGGGVSTTNQYGSNVTSYNGTAGYYGRTAPNTGGGKAMPSLVPVQNPYAGYTGTAGYWGAGNQPAVVPVTMRGGQPATQTPSPYAGYTGTAGYGWQQQAGGSLSADKQSPIQPSGQMSGDKQGALGNAAPAPFQTPTTNGMKAQGNIPPRPQGQYTGNPDDPNTALWKARWKWEAENPVAAQDEAIKLGLYTAAPTVMTRSQIWEMKANQRRANIASMEQDGTLYNQPAYQYDTGREAGSAPPLVRNITWGI